MALITLTHTHSLVTPGYVVKDWIARFAGARLIEYVHGLQSFELLLFVHLMLDHNFFEVR